MKARHQRATSDLFALLRQKAPAKPSCFRSQEDWISWLHASESAVQFSVIRIVGRTGKGEANRGRVKTDRVRTDIDFCSECQWEHAELMRSVGKCAPPPHGIPPCAPSDSKAVKTKTAKRPRLPAVPVVSLNADTWHPKVFSDIYKVKRSGFELDAVLASIRTGQIHKGHYWKLADEFLKKPPALPKLAASLDAMTAYLSDTQMALPLESFT
jgi:hypothetical protein